MKIKQNRLLSWHLPLKVMELGQGRRIIPHQVKKLTKENLKTLLINLIFPSKKII